MSKTVSRGKIVQMHALVACVQGGIEGTFVALSRSMELSARAGSSTRRLSDRAAGLDVDERTASFQPETRHGARLTNDTMLDAERIASPFCAGRAIVVNGQPVPIEGKGLAHFGQTDIQPDRPAGSGATRERGERSWRAAFSLLPSARSRRRRFRAAGFLRRMEADGHVEGRADELQHMREVFVRQAPRGVVRPIEVGEVALAAGLHHQLADPEIV